MFSCTLDKLYEQRLPEMQLAAVRDLRPARDHRPHNEIYKRAGAVHGCALCRGTEIVTFVEDVGRHNAADAIAGMMWLDGTGGGDKVFYTTGRLTSEIVMKTANMGIPALLSRSGITHMGLELAQDLGMLMIAAPRAATSSSTTAPSRSSSMRRHRQSPPRTRRAPRKMHGDRRKLFDRTCRPRDCRAAGLSV